MPKISWTRSAIRLPEESRGHDAPAPPALDRAACGNAELAPALGGQGEDRGEAVVQHGSVAGGEGEERCGFGPDLFADAGRDLG